MENNGSFWKQCAAILGKYIGGSLLDAVLVGGLTAAFMVLMGMPHVLLISVVVGLSNLIPTVGGLLGALAGGVLLLFDRPIQALWFLLFTVALQALDGYVIRPRLFGKSLGVPSVVVLAATLAGGWLFGIPGVLLAVPAAAIGMLLWRRRGAAREEPPEEEQK